jgi:hypothetical protein
LKSNYKHPRYYSSTISRQKYKKRTNETSTIVSIETDANLNKSKNNKSEISEKDLLRSFDGTSVALFA